MCQPLWPPTPPPPPCLPLLITPVMADPERSLFKTPNTSPAAAHLGKCQLPSPDHLGQNLSDPHPQEMSLGPRGSSHIGPQGPPAGCSPLPSHPAPGKAHLEPMALSASTPKGPRCGSSAGLPAAALPPSGQLSALQQRAPKCTASWPSSLWMLWMQQALGKYFLTFPPGALLPRPCVRP